MDNKAHVKHYDIGDLVLRCYGRRIDENKWYGVCLNLNLATEARSREELVQKMEKVIESYLYTVLDTEDTDSIPDLLTRRAPISDWLTYYAITSLIYIKQFPTLFKFKQAIPFHLGYGH
jgi:hypothetical protein